jgi:nucleoside-diphosphate-sugar epimerase
MRKQNILVTGLSGVVGSAIITHLKDKYHLTALNRSDILGVPCHRADIANLEDIKPVFQGQDAVVHLAAFLGDTSWETTLSTNIIGTYNVFEAARQANVQRVLFASSGAVVHGYENEPPLNAIVYGQYDAVPEIWPILTAESPVRPTTLYGASKVWGEGLARYYSETYNLSCICLRLGRITMQDRPSNPRHAAVYCSLRDAAQMIDRCLTAPASLRFDIFYVVSNNRWRFRDIEHAYKTIGFAPQDCAETS